MTTGVGESARPHMPNQTSYWYGQSVHWLSVAQRGQRISLDVHRVYLNHGTYRFFVGCGKGQALETVRIEGVADQYKSPCGIEENRTHSLNSSTGIRIPHAKADYSS